MITTIIEATSQNDFNWGKFLLAQMTGEWVRKSVVSGSKRSLLSEIGVAPEQLWVLDLQTGEGALFRPRPGGDARYDLNRHRIWVCPLFEPFLVWLYQQKWSPLEDLPTCIKLEAEEAFSGYRREGSS